MAKENSSLLPGPFSNLRDLNLGIVLVAIYFLFDFGGYQGLYEFVNEYRLPYFLAASSVIYALYLILTKRVDFNSSTTKVFIILALFEMGDTWLRSKSPQVVHSNTRQFLHFLANYLIIVSCVKKPSQFILLIDIWLAAIIHSSYHAIMQGGKLYANIWLKDENHISIIAAYAIPFALVLFMNYRYRLKKTCYAIALAFYVSVVVVAASRGGAVAMICVVFLCWLLYERKIRNLLAIVMVAVLTYSFAPKQFFSEMETLKQGTGESTAADRIYLWKIALRMFYDHPIVGVGPLNYPFQMLNYDIKGYYHHRYVDKGGYRVAHSTPLQWLAEHGVIGSFILLLLQVCMYMNWRFVFKHRESLLGAKTRQDDIVVFKSISNACGISQIGFWVAALFLTLQPYPFYWCLIPFSETWRKLFQEYIESKELDY